MEASLIERMARVSDLEPIRQVVPLPWGCQCYHGIEQLSAGHHPRDYLVRTDILPFANDDEVIARGKDRFEEGLARFNPSIRVTDLRGCGYQISRVSRR